MLHIIGGKHKGRKLIAPDSELVRPTLARVREALFDICQNEVPGAHFLDLFAGSGAIGLEALSRGAYQVTFVERERSALITLRSNIERLQEQAETRVIPGNVRTLLPALSETFDLIYADPPYTPTSRTALATTEWDCEVLRLLDSYPNLLSKQGRFFLEAIREEFPPLKNLTLRKKRCFGNTRLYEYGLIR